MARTRNFHAPDATLPPWVMIGNQVFASHGCNAASIQDSSGDQAGSEASVGVTIWRSLKPAMSMLEIRAE